MKCRKCGATMEKDFESRLATCPICGRMVSYKTKYDKRRINLEQEYAVLVQQERTYRYGCAIAAIVLIIVLVIIGFVVWLVLR